MMSLMWVVVLSLGSSLFGVREAEQTLEVIETAPVETSLADPDLRKFAEVWRLRIQAAKSSIELAHFYASEDGDSLLSPVIDDLKAAAGRGVRVRFLVDERFCKTYPETIARLSEATGLDVRRYDLRSLTGGVMHAKYMLVDGQWTVLGSANFDWRSLEHILELGVMARSAQLCRAYLDVFELDWHLAGGGLLEEAPEPRSTGAEWPLVLKLGSGASVSVRPSFCPTGLLPNEEDFELPQLVQLIDAAREQVVVQLLTYRTSGYGGEYFAELETALRRAAARGVQVRLCVADWGKRRGTLEGLGSLQLIPNIEVRFVTIPEASEGHIPFARVIHSKFLVCDSRAAWVGTSNWEGSYFKKGRNVGLVMHGDELGRKLMGRFEATWASEYAYPVDPCKSYEVPRFGD